MFDQILENFAQPHPQVYGVGKIADVWNSHGNVSQNNYLHSTVKDQSVQAVRGKDLQINDEFGGKADDKRHADNVNSGRQAEEETDKALSVREE